MECLSCSSSSSSSDGENCLGDLVFDENGNQVEYYDEMDASEEDYDVEDVADSLPVYDTFQRSHPVKGKTPPHGTYPTDPLHYGH